VSKEKTQTCKDCKWWDILCCRRRSPIVVENKYSSTSGVSARWPPVDFNDWCGEFEAKLDADEMIDISLLKSLSRGSREFECDK